MIHNREGRRARDRLPVRTVAPLGAYVRL